MPSFHENWDAGRLPGRVCVPSSQRNPWLPKALDDVLRRDLARDPQDRYSSVDQFQKTLAKACYPPATPNRLRMLAVAAAVAALAIYKWTSSATMPATPTASPLQQAPNSVRPDQLIVLFDKSDDLSLFARATGEELTSGTELNVERIKVETSPRDIPLECRFQSGPRHARH